MSTDQQNHRESSRELNVYTGGLSLVITECENVLKLLDEVMAGAVPFRTPQLKNTCLQMTLSGLVTNLCKLFDHEEKAASFKRLASDIGEQVEPELLKRFQSRFEEIREKHQRLLVRMRNNRNRKFVHHQWSGEELGWDPVTAEALNEWYRMTGSIERYEPDEEENQHITLSALPRAQFDELLRDLKGLIHLLWNLPVAASADYTDQGLQDEVRT